MMLEARMRGHRILCRHSQLPAIKLSNHQDDSLGLLWPITHALLDPAIIALLLLSCDIEADI